MAQKCVGFFFFNFSEEDAYPGVRDIDIVEPSSPSNVAQGVSNDSNSVEATDSGNTSSSISDQIIHLSNRTIQNSQQRAVRNVSDCLMNPRNDPLFSQGLSNISSENSRDTDLSLLGSESVPVPPEIASDNRMRGDRIPAPGDIYHSASIPSVVDTMSHPSQYSTVDSQVTLNSSIPLSVQTQAESLRSSITSCSDINPYLARYIKGQSSNKTSKSSLVSQPTKQFPSIRDRLQTSIPLASETNNGAANNAVSIAGIPPVTVLSLSELCIPVTAQSNTDSSTHPVSVVKSLAGGQTYNTSMIKLCSSSTAVTSTLPSCKSSVSEKHVAAGSKHLAPSERTIVQDCKGLKSMNTMPPDSTIPTRDTCIAKNTTPNSNNDSAGTLEDGKSNSEAEVSRNATFNIPNSSIRESSSQNVQMARAETERRHYKNKVQPYTLPRQPRHSSLMGPYVESRGLRAPGQPGSSDSFSVRALPANHQTQSNNYVHSKSHHTQRDNNRQCSVSTESSTNSSETQSGYYFLPISENSRSNTESTTIQNSGNQVSIVTRPEHSDPSQTFSQSSGNNSNHQNIELFVDQNENYTAVRNANNTQTSQPVNEVQVSTNDNNNNSLHIIQQDPVVSLAASIPHSDTNQDYIALRNTFVSMTDQIEREMSDLNRRINALRDSFNQSLFSIRQDRQRYESVGQAPETATPSSSFSVVEPSSAASTESRNVPVIITSTTEPESAENEEQVDMPGKQKTLITSLSFLSSNSVSVDKSRILLCIYLPFARGQNFSLCQNERFSGYNVGVV